MLCRFLVLVRIGKGCFIRQAIGLRLLYRRLRLPARRRHWRLIGNRFVGDGHGRLLYDCNVRLFVLLDGFGSAYRHAVDDGEKFTGADRLADLQLYRSILADQKGGKFSHIGRL